MPRYFFHLQNDIHVHDEEGQELPDDGAALDAAVKFARDMASHSVREGHLALSHFIRCAADDGREVGVVRFADAICINN
jgi:hypothetical protein